MAKNPKIPTEPNVPQDPPAPPAPPTPVLPPAAPPAPALQESDSPPPEPTGKVLTKTFLIGDPGAVGIRVLSTCVFLNDGRKNWQIPRVGKKKVAITVTVS